MEMAGSLPWLIFVVTLLVASIKCSMASGMAKPGCQETCGNLTIPYPFGIGPGCYREGFDVSCENNTVFFRNSSSSNTIIYNIDLLRGQARVSTLIATKCFNYSSNDTYAWVTSRVGSLFAISNKANMLTAIGCNTRAFQSFQGIGGETGVWCYSSCDDKKSVDISGQCSGKGCCQTSIAAQLTFSKMWLDRLNNSGVRGFNPCSYAFIAAHDWFKFEPSYLEGYNTFRERLHGIVPTVMDWVAGNISCHEAVKNASSYACISKNGHCIMPPNATGYLCGCNTGFEGNPYLEEGCKDIDECRYPNLHPCHGTCSNTIGSYNCACPPGTNSRDPRGEPCSEPIPSKLTTGLIVAIGVGSGAGLLLLVLGSAFMTQKLKQRRAKMLRQKFFNQNRGHLLEQLVSQKADIAERMIIPMEELEKATNNFDKAREIGRGGHGTVYKGILSDLHVVAIKKSKITVQREIDEFINEVAILSQINHRNVVKLFGCCLETEVPLLAYEFISNGTLYHHLHVEEHVASLSWDDRLRIATETAKALAYLHSAVAFPIIHRDIKSQNILLDDTLVAKVSDFGASRSIPVDEATVVTNVQGTIGYMDPMYYCTGRLTEKSDVYSFGVLLMELLTRKPYSYRSSEDNNLLVYFTRLLTEGNLVHVLDPQVVKEAGKEVEEVAVLAVACVRMEGENRPTMRQVEMVLESLRAPCESILQPKIDTTSCTLVERGGDKKEASTQYSLEEEYLLSSRYPR